MTDPTTNKEVEELLKNIKIEDNKDSTKEQEIKTKFEAYKAIKIIEGKYECPICFYISKTQNGCRIHIVKVHKELLNDIDKTYKKIVDQKDNSDDSDVEESNNEDIKVGESSNESSKNEDIKIGESSISDKQEEPSDKLVFFTPKQEYNKYYFHESKWDQENMTLKVALNSIIKDDDMYLCSDKNCEHSNKEYGFFDIKLCKTHVRRHFHSEYKFYCDYPTCKAKPLFTKGELKVHKFNVHNIDMEEKFIVDEFAQSYLDEVAEYKIKKDLACPINKCGKQCVVY
jgi:hypothetical protein